ncbi:MAG TPA: hypothetical protein VKW08_02380 [Xanthobacteraceae bacterium]|nr:hypothetical protein [Xanthobacteraceae bacterium]
MQDVITIGKRLVPTEQIAFVEPFDPTSNPEFKPEKEFKARVVLLNRETVLAETSLKELADAHGFRVLAEDAIAVNPAIAFRVETFSPTDTFNPDKPYATRLKWRDLEGNDQSKLLLSKPEAVMAIVVRGGEDLESARGSRAKRPPRSRSRRRKDASPAPAHS